MEHSWILQCLAGEQGQHMCFLANKANENSRCSWVLCQILVIFEFRLVSCFCSMVTAGLHTRALFPINCLQREEEKYQRPYTVQIS